MAGAVPPLRFLFRADASPRGGNGHVMRCFALAEQCRAEGGSVTFVSFNLPRPLFQKLKKAGFAIDRLTVPPGGREDALWTVQRAAQMKADWLVVDGYHFRTSFKSEVSRWRSGGLLVMDDMGAWGFEGADVLVNGNPLSEKKTWGPWARKTALLLGAPYLFLRKEFENKRRVQPGKKDFGQRLLVSLGGSDPVNMTSRVIRWLRGVSVPLTVRVLLSPTNTHRKDIEKLCRLRKIKIYKNPSDMVKVMRWADAAVSAGGGTCWELAFLGIPCAIVSIAENQRDVARAMARAEAGIDLGPHNQLTKGEFWRKMRGFLIPNKLKEMRARGPKLVDGKGVRRVLAFLKTKTIRLRPAKARDARLLWRWTNDPAVRAHSFSSRAIGWEEHRRWFKECLRSRDQRLYIGDHYLEGPIGLVRTSPRTPTTREVHFQVAREHRGQGWSPLLLKRSLYQEFQFPKLQSMHARIKRENAASRSAFLRAGFTEKMEKEGGDPRCLHATFHRKKGQRKVS